MDIVGGMCAQDFQRFEVAPWPAAKIEDGERRLTFYVLKQGPDVLANVVSLSSLPEIISAVIIMTKRSAGDALYVLRFWLHVC
jgi:hypothetical protein